MQLFEHFFFTCGFSFHQPLSTSLSHSRSSMRVKGLVFFLKSKGLSLFYCVMIYVSDFSDGVLREVSYIFYCIFTQKAFSPNP